MALIDVVNRNLRIQDTILDIGCGDKVLSKQFKCKMVITLDAWDKVDPDILADLEVEDLPFTENSVDVVIMLDFIEHLSKDRGVVIIEQAKKIARRSIILLTPLWWTDNSVNVNDPDMWCYGNIFDYHKSLWTLEDFAGWNRFTNNPNVSDKYFVGAWTKK
jgi:hypothetical protein